MPQTNKKKKQQQQQQQQPQPLPGSASTTNYREIQAAEVDVLRSIYDADFETVDVGNAAWSVRLRFLLSLSAEQLLTILASISKYRI